MEDMDRTSSPETWCLEGTYSEKDLRAFAAFLAGRVAGSKFWALGAFVLMPLWWSGDIRRTWPIAVPVGILLVGFLFLLRFAILPNRLYKSAIRLPGVFEPRCIVIDQRELQNRSEAGGHTLLLADVREVIATPDHLFVMATAKQGIPIPRTWIGDDERTSRLTAHLLAGRTPSTV